MQCKYLDLDPIAVRHHLSEMALNLPCALAALAWCSFSFCKLNGDGLLFIAPLHCNMGDALKSGNFMLRTKGDLFSELLAEGTVHLSPHMRPEVCYSLAVRAFARLYKHHLTSCCPKFDCRYVRNAGQFDALPSPSNMGTVATQGFANQARHWSFVRQCTPVLRDGSRRANRRHDRRPGQEC